MKSSAVAFQVTPSGNPGYASLYAVDIAMVPNVFDSPGTPGHRGSAAEHRGISGGCGSRMAQAGLSVVLQL